MANKGKKQGAAHKDAKAADSKGKKPGHAFAVMSAVVIIVVAAAIIGYVFVVPQILPGAVQFSSFKSTFQSAQRVSVVASYGNQTQYANESPCFSSVIHTIAYSGRKLSTIDFFLINQANATCTYSKTGLGGSVVPQQSNASYCLGIAGSEPAIFLNYSGVNSTRITQNRLYAYGNSGYMAECPIAVEIS
ncbi:MAG: hypothetical protein M1569_01300 [Candidatus Marsarchaeota archaeon]|nr:hypothetical protein [Candidatus Marsarchaeota archaeon]